MNIGDVANETGLSPKAIRYYEKVGLIDQPDRSANGYRSYSQHVLRQLRFIGAARRLGFGVGECGELLALYANDRRRSADVKALAMRRIAEVDQRIRELQALRQSLLELSTRCHGDFRPDCPILDQLSAEETEDRGRDDAMAAKGKRAETAA